MTFRLALLAALLSCSPPILFAQTAPSSPDEPDILRGLVLNALTREPVARVLVFSPDNRFATLTDERGRFQFTFAKPSQSPPENGQPVPQVRPYELWLRKPGFLSHDDQQRFPVPFSEHDITLTIIPEALIVGRVTLPPGANQATVELFLRQFSQNGERWQSAGALTARSNGEFRFSNLRAGDYKLFTHEITESDPLTFDPAKQFGFPPIYFPASPDFASAAVIRLNAGQTFQATLAPSRHAYYPVKIRVLNASANGGGQLEVYPEGHPGPGYSLGYDPSTSLITGALPDGVFTVKLSGFGPSPSSGEVSLTVGPAAPSPALMMLPNPSLIVRVKNEMQQSYGFGQSEQRSGASSRPPSPAQEFLRYFQLELISDAAIEGGQAYQAAPPDDPQADFLIVSGVRPGRYRVRPNCSVPCYVASVTSAGTDLLHKPLVVAAGASIPQLEVTLRDDGAQITGEVQLNSQQLPHPADWFRSTYQSPGFLYFIPTPDSTGQFRQFWINSDGKFDVQQLPPGEYRVLAVAKVHPELQFATEESLRKLDSQAKLITVGPGEKLKLQLSLTPEEDLP